MKNIYSTHIVPENQENLILSYFCQGCIYHLWYNKPVFVLVEEYKNDANKGKPTIKNLTLDEVKELFMSELRFEGFVDKNVLFLDWDLWHKMVIA